MMFSLFSHQLFYYLIGALIIGAGEGWLWGITVIYGNERVIIKSLLIKCKPILHRSTSPYSTTTLLDQINILYLRNGNSLAVSKRKIVTFNGYALLSYFYILIVV